MEAIKAVDNKFKSTGMQSVEFELAQDEQIIGASKDLIQMDEDIQVVQVRSDHLSLTSEYLELGNSRPIALNSSITAFSNKSEGPRRISFGSTNFGEIIPIELQNTQTVLYCMNHFFLCAQGRGIQLNQLSSNRMLCKECMPFIMEEISGEGVVYVGSMGKVLHRQLEADEELRIDLNCLIAMSDHVQYDFQVVGSSSSDECMCFATILGPGDVWLQSTSINQV